MLSLGKGRLRARSDQVPQPLEQGWQLCATAPGQVAGSEDVALLTNWLDAPLLGPVADVLRQTKHWSLDGEPRRFDAQDWCYRLCFDLADADAASPHVLGLDGLATVVDVWLNGQLLLRSENMFLAHRLPLTGLQAAGNELLVVCRSLDQALAKRRPRPRWRAPMIDNQQLRWFRCTLLGRTPGWSPPAAVVGPWRGVWLAKAPSFEVEALSMQPAVQADSGRLRVACRLTQTEPAASRPEAAIAQVQLCLTRQGQAHRLPLVASPAEPQVWSGELDIPSVARWWPHTHGEPALYEASLEVWLAGGLPPVTLALGPVGFKTVELVQCGGGFALRVNGTPVFCRGACWTPLDPVTLDAPSEQAYTQALAQVREAGMNMVRVGGTMSYEADAFYDECDRQGIMVWQEFMFANMDYPEDAAFMALASQEAEQQLQRWQGRAALTVLCGNSEVEQQAAMFGATRERWAPALFHEVLAQACAVACPQVPYWPSSAHGGAFPHQADVGTTSYYGVGAYLRDLGDARRANVRFATECLAFSNAPESATLAAVPGGLGLRMHHPAWKARAPRDLGAGWDFEDVRDHYVAQLFGLDPARLRYSDHERYLTLGRVAVGEVMAATFAEWRRAASTCGGALIWFLRDLWPGAGWGVIDSSGLPKAPYHYLKRTLQPLSLSMTDEGGNGLYVHVCNDGPQPLQAQVQITAWRNGRAQVGQGSQAVQVPAHASQSWPLMACFDWFADWSWAYRFGPASAQVLQARLVSQDGQVLAQAFAFPAGLALPVVHDLGMRAVASTMGPDQVALRISTDQFAQAVHLDVDDCVPDDNYFHMAPASERTVVLRVAGGLERVLTGTVRALNTDKAVPIQHEGQVP